MSKGDLDNEEKNLDYGTANTDVLPPAQAYRPDEEELATTHQGKHGVKRDLKPRHISMISIAGTLGTGLFLGSGGALTKGGPVGMWLGYVFLGSLCGLMMAGLGEMICFNPNIGGFIGMGTQYVDPAFGFMMGINYLLQTAVGFPAEVTASANLVSWWDKNPNHEAAYIVVFIVFCAVTNLIGVRYFGEVEFFFATIKVATLVGLILFGIIVNCGGVPPLHDHIGGRYWKTEPFNDHFHDITPVTAARFLGFWGVLTKAAFSYAGLENVALYAGEAHNPRKSMRTAVRTVFYRIVGLYMISTLVLGLDVSQYSPELLQANALGGKTAASSPFVVIISQAKVKVLPSIVNGVVMTSALSSGNQNLYAFSRITIALADQGGLPKIFLRTTKSGVPIAGVCTGIAFGLLAFLTLSDGSAQAFNWLSNLTALGGLVIWITVSFAYTRFRKALRLQGIDRSKLPFKSYGQPYFAWICVCAFSLVVFFNGFETFIGVFDYKGFLASYINIPVICLAFFGYKYFKKTKIVALEDIDLSMGPTEALVGTQYDRGSANPMGSFPPSRAEGDSETSQSYAAPKY